MAKLTSVLVCSTVLLFWQVSFVHTENSADVHCEALRKLQVLEEKKVPAIKEVHVVSLTDAMRSCLENTDCVSFDFHQSSQLCSHYRLWNHGGSYVIRSRRCAKAEGFCHCTADLDFCLILYENVNVGWNQARQYCHNRGGDLVSLDTDEKFYFTKGIIGPKLRNFWLGATRTGNEWRWVNGERLSLTNRFWHSNRPDNTGGNQHYLMSYMVYFKTFGFDDGPDDGRFKHNFICEF